MIWFYHSFFNVQWHYLKKYFQNLEYLKENDITPILAPILSFLGSTAEESRKFEGGNVPGHYQWWTGIKAKGDQKIRFRNSKHFFILIRLQYQKWSGSWMGNNRTAPPFLKVGNLRKVWWGEKIDKKIYFLNIYEIWLIISEKNYLL